MMTNLSIIIVYLSLFFTPNCLFNFSYHYCMFVFFPFYHFSCFNWNTFSEKKNIKKLLKTFFNLLKPKKKRIFQYNDKKKQIWLHSGSSPKVQGLHKNSCCCYYLFTPLLDRIKFIAHMYVVLYLFYFVSPFVCLLFLHRNHSFTWIYRHSFQFLIPCILNH